MEEEEEEFITDRNGVTNDRLHWGARGLSLEWSMKEELGDAGWGHGEGEG